MTTKSDFAAAEEIKGILNGRDKTEQERILRWVSESLGMVSSPPVSPPSPLVPGATPPVNLQPGSRPRDIKSFVNEKKPKSDNQFAAVVAYYYRFEAPQTDRKDELTPDDLLNAGRMARGFGFKNPIMTLTNAMNVGYFDRSGRGSFKLNAVGENLVAMALPGSGTESSGNGGRRSSKKAKKTTKKATR
jgi:hypothetical protein